MTGRAVIALIQDELRALLLKTREHDYRSYLLFLVKVVHGLRVSEVINLKVKDFTFDGKDWYLTVQRLKGSNKTTQKLINSNDPIFDKAPLDPLFDEARLMSEWLEGMKPKD